MKYCPVMPRCMVDAMPRDMQLYTRIERQDEHENQYQIRQVPVSEDSPAYGPAPEVSLRTGSSVHFLQVLRSFLLLQTA